MSITQTPNAGIRLHSGLIQPEFDTILSWVTNFQHVAQIQKYHE